MGRSVIGVVVVVVGGWGLPFMRVLSLSGAKMEQNTSAWILSAEISLECDAGPNTVRLSHRGRLIFSLSIFCFTNSRKKKTQSFFSRVDPNLITKESIDL